MPENSSSEQRHGRLFRGEAEKTVRELLKRQFGVELPELRFYVGGKNRVYCYKECEFNDMASHKGIYFGTVEKDGLRLSIEGSYIVGRFTDRVVEVDDVKALEWLSGKNIEAEVEGYWIVKWKDKGYFLGCGKGNGKFLRNFVPKDRRIKI